MPTIRGLSAKTIEADPVSLECFLTFLTDHEHIDRGKVSFDHFDPARLKAWLGWIADDKHYAKRGSSPDRVGLAVSMPGVRGVGQLGS